MVFSSLVFLFCFLPATLLCYFASPRPARNLVLALASLVFYVWGAQELLWALPPPLGNNFPPRIPAEPHCTSPGRSARRLVVVIAVVANLALLGYFKYAHFVSEQIAS